MKTDALTCLRPLPDRVSRWLSDELSQEELRDGFTCLRTTIHHFETRARGRGNSDQLSNAELGLFINEVLPRDYEMSASMVEHLMRLKVLFFGGNSEILTRQELREMGGFLHHLEKMAQAVNGRMRVLLFQAKPAEVTSESLQNHQKVAEEALRDLMNQSAIVGTPYEFNDFRQLVEAFYQYLRQPPLLAQMVRWLPFVESMKNLFLGKHIEFTSKKNWNFRYTWIAKSYSHALSYFYQVRPLGLKTAGDAQVLMSWIDASFDLAESSRAVQDLSLLPMPEINSAVQALLGTGVLASWADPETLKRVIPTLPEAVCKAIGHLVEGPQGREILCHQVPGITARGLSVLRFEWSVFSLAQQQINAAFGQQSEIPYGRFLDSMQRFAAVQTPISFRLWPNENAVLIESLKHWRQIMEQPFPPIWRPDNRLFVGWKSSETVMSFSGMLVANSLRSIARLIMRGFGEPHGNSLDQYQLSRSALVTFEKEFRRFGRAIQFLDPRNDDAANRTFDEASFFTWSARGAEHLSFMELFEAINILVSSGRQVAASIYDESLKSGCEWTDQAGQQHLDVMGKIYMKSKCVFATIRQKLPQLFSSIPSLESIYQGMPSAQAQSDFDETLEKLGFMPGTRTEIMSLGEIRTVATVLHYVEILRLVYDANRDGVLSEAELQKAEPRFRRFVKKALQERLEKASLVVRYFFSDSAEKAFYCMVYQQSTDVGLCVVTWPTVRPLGYYDLLKVLQALKGSSGK